MNQNSMRENGILPYTAVITREHFLFYEMRTTAKLLCEEQSEEAVIKRIREENLFQYPTEKSLKRTANTCIKRLEALENPSLISEIANQPVTVSKQICLYAMMKQYRLVWEFMITVIGEKYRLLDFSFGKIDLESYFFRLQEQDDHVASWSDSTVTKIKQVLKKTLVETQYLDTVRSTKLNPVLLDPLLEQAIRDNGDKIALPAFNCFS